MELGVIEVIFLLVSVMRSVGAECKCSRVDKSFGRLLSRKKRLVVFPKSSTILLTPSFTKALITGYPRGLVTSTEIDIYHPLPETIDGWRPKIFDEPTTKSPPMMKKDPLLVSDFSPDYQNVWIPPSGWQDKTKFDFSWNVPKREQWFSHKPSKHWIYDNTAYNDIYSDPYSWSDAQKFGQNNDHLYGSKWMHHPSVRERRDIFDTIKNAASLLGFNIKACILRTICETKHVLLPPGKSFVQDVIRILFTFPEDDDNIDGKNNSTEVSEKDCHARYKDSCPISITEFLLHGDRII